MHLIRLAARAEMVSYTRDAIVSEARRWIGTPYHHQASPWMIGTDCLGLVRGVWRTLHGSEVEMPPPYTPDWAESAGHDALLAGLNRHMLRRASASARPGDVLLFRCGAQSLLKHAAILSRTARPEGSQGSAMIHAIQGRAVHEVPLGTWWRRRLAAVFSFPGTAD